MPVLTAREILASETRVVEAFLSAVLGDAYAPGDIRRVTEESATGRIIAVSDDKGLAMLIPFAIACDGLTQAGAPVYHPRVQDARGAMLAAAAEEMMRLGAEFVHTALTATDPARDAFVGGGFTPGSAMLDMSRPAPVTAQPAALPEGARWIFYAEDRREAFAQVFYGTLEGSLDATEVPVCRDGARLMRSFEERGAHDAEDFALLEIEGRPAGIALFVTDGATLEIAYLGVLPERRGRGLGTLLAARALERAAAHKARTIIVTVDSANAPALAIYRRTGFSENRAVRIYYLAKKKF